MIYQDKGGMKSKQKLSIPINSDTVHLDSFEEISFKKSD